MEDLLLKLLRIYTLLSKCSFDYNLDLNASTGALRCRDSLDVS